MIKLIRKIDKSLLKIDYIAKCSQSIVTNQFKEETSEFTLLDKLKNFQQDSLEWEKASQFLCESLASNSDLEIQPPMPTQTEEAKPGL